MLHSLRCVGAEDFKRWRTSGRFVGVGGVLAGATSQSEIASQREIAKDLDECLVLGREEIGIRELRALVGETDKLLRNF